MAQETDGWPDEHLRTDFKRLRERWYALCRQHLDTLTFNKVVNPLNTRLAGLSKSRGYAIHGVWYRSKRGRYEVRWWEQTDDLQNFSVSASLGDVRELANETERALADFVRLASG